MLERKKYSKEYKLDAVSLVTDLGYSRAEAARSLGINSNMLCRWVQEEKASDGQAFRGNGKLTSTHSFTLVSGFAFLTLSPTPAVSYFLDPVVHFELEFAVTDPVRTHAWSLRSISRASLSRYSRVAIR